MDEVTRARLAKELGAVDEEISEIVVENREYWFEFDKVKKKTKVCFDKTLLSSFHTVRRTLVYFFSYRGLGAASK